MRLISRRAVLVAACLSLPRIAVAAGRGELASVPLPISNRIATGNSVLTPAAATSDGVFFAGDGAVGAVDPQCRSLTWRRDLGPGEGCLFRPRLGAGVMVCGSGEILAAWKAADGTPLWRLRPKIRFGVPLVDDGRVIVGDGHRIVAFAAENGTELWSFAATPDTLVSYAVTAAAKTILAGPGDGRLYALDKMDGRLKWQVDGVKRWQYLRQIQVADGILVAGAYKETLHGIDPVGGGELWSFNAGNFINSQHVADGVAYLWSPTGWIYAIDIQSGAVQWRHRTTDYRGSPGNWGAVIAELATMGERLLVLDMRDVLHVLARQDGAETRRFKAPDGCRPFVVPLPDDTVVLGGRDGTLIGGRIGG